MVLRPSWQYDARGWADPTGDPENSGNPPDLRAA